MLTRPRAFIRMSDSKNTVTIKTRKFLVNSLLKRKQMVLDVHHPGQGPPSKEELRKLLAKKFNVKNDKCVFVFGFRTAFGGIKTTGFALIYNSLEEAQNTEPKYRLRRNGLMAKPTGSRKSRKELKNKLKKFRNKAKVKARGGGA